MLQEITRDNIGLIRNPVFRDYAEMYLEIAEGFLAQVEQFGLPFCKEGTDAAETAACLSRLKARPDITARCDDASLVYNRISSACEACKNGVGTVTSYVSFRCHRNCFFCFNPNQDNFETNRIEKNDCCAELDRIHASGANLTHIALTGGEPLLHVPETLAFFAHARTLYPEAHLRLYTSGDLLTAELLAQLRDHGLHEIRFSYKMEDAPDLQEKVLANMALAKAYIPYVMVEMPVMPDMEQEMQALLRRLDTIGIWSINLLELCFPYNNAPAFAARGFMLKYPPYRTLYNFWYAGGLPIAGSELVALRLMEFAAEEKLQLGIHYCSLENKNFGQMYQQNKMLAPHHPTLLFSEQDYYLKTVKAFGDEALLVKKLFDRRGVTRYLYDARAGYIQFHPADASHLRGRPVEPVLSVNVLEPRDGEVITRELKLLRATVDDCLRLV